MSLFYDMILSMWFNNYIIFRENYRIFNTNNIYRYMKHFKLVTERIDIHLLPWISKLVSIAGYLVNFQNQKIK